MDSSDDAESSDQDQLTVAAHVRPGIEHGLDAI